MAEDRDGDASEDEAASQKSGEFYKDEKKKSDASEDEADNESSK